jgi:Predicted AAA-ATPase
MPIHTIATERTTKRKVPPHTDIVPSPKRTRVGTSSLRINGELEFFQSGLDENFSKLLRREGQAYFDRTGYIFKLHEIPISIFFCRPRRFGKSLTVSMLEHFHGLQYADEHQYLYEVRNKIFNYLDVRTYFSFNHSRVSMCKKISTKEK